MKSATSLWVLQEELWGFPASSTWYGVRAANGQLC